MEMSKTLGGGVMLAAMAVTSLDASAYCTSSGNSTSYEWINSITVGTDTRTSGNNYGYADSTSPALVLGVGDTPVTLRPGFRSGSYTERWRVWIDFDQNDVFDAGEVVMSGSSRSSVSGTIAIPPSAAGVTTGMRVSMRYGGEPPACGNFTYGEVEDYTVSIAGGDQTPPTVEDYYPPAGSVNVSVDDIVSILFSEPMDPATVDTTAVSVTRDGASIAGTLTLESDFLTFVPDAPWPASAQVDVTASTQLEDTSGNALTTPLNWSFTTEMATPEGPSVDQIAPQNGAVDVSVNHVVSALFTNPMNAATFTPSSFTVSEAGMPISGSISVNANRADFYPAGALAEGTEYVVVVNESVQDTNGLSLGADYTWSFTTREAEPDYCSLYATEYDTFWINQVKVGSFTYTNSSTPATGYSDATSTVFQLSRTFSNSLTLTAGFWNQPFNVSWDVFIDWNKNGAFEASERVHEDYTSQSSQASLAVPAGALEGKTRMRVVTSTLSSAPACGSFTSGHVTDFRVEIPADLTPPTVTSISPANASINVPVASSILVSFSEPVVSDTVIGRLNVTTSATPVTGQISFANNGQQAVFTPDQPLAYDTAYSVVVDAGIEDLAGNATGSSAAATFDTEMDPGAAFALSGMVTDGSAPMDQVEITVTGASNLTVVTDSNGQFSLAPLAPGSYTLTASKSGYAFSPESMQLDIVDSDISNIQFTGNALVNVITNGDFSAGTLAGFTTYKTPGGSMSSGIAYTDVTGDGQTSPAAQFVVGTSGFPNGAREGGGIVQTVALGGGDLTINMAIAASTGSNNGDGGLVEVFFDGVLMDSHDFGSISSGITERSTLSFSVADVAAGNHELRIQFTRKYMASSVSNYVDDITAGGTSTQN